MAQFYPDIGQAVLLVGLLFFSAFFSGTETAYFNLTRRQIDQFKASRHKLCHLASVVAAQPRRLLNCLLFGNMMVNVLYFAVASVTVLRTEDNLSSAAAAAMGAGLFVLLLLFGEIVPKSVSYTHSPTISVTTAVPAFVCVKILSPIVGVFSFILVEPAVRLILGPVKHPESISRDEFKSLISHIKKRGLITADENRLLGEIVELNLLKVRHCLRPRVDMMVCDVKDGPAAAREKMCDAKLTKIPVYSGHSDNIVGFVHLRDVLLTPELPLERLVRKVDFVPEQKTIESLLEFFRREGTDCAVVVDEYGGIAGLISLEDIAEEVFGVPELPDGSKVVQPVGHGRYRLAGSVGIHDWARTFGIKASEARFSTIGGFVAALLGRIPRTGETARLKNLKFTVEKVEKGRVKTVILELEPQKSDAL